MRGLQMGMNGLMLAMRRCAAAMGIVFGVGAAHADENFVAKVVHVDDGDTVSLLVERSEVKVRLGSIDAPERAHTNRQTGRIGQPFAANSKRALEEMVKGKEVAARCFSEDRYGRRICDLAIGGVWVNGEMVRRGMAWPYTGAGGRYLRHRELISVAERAREERVGLWALPNPVEPWNWRKRCWEDGDCPQ